MRSKVRWQVDEQKDHSFRFCYLARNKCVNASCQRDIYIGSSRNRKRKTPTSKKAHKIGDDVRHQIFCKYNVILNETHSLCTDCYALPFDSLLFNDSNTEESIKQIPKYVQKILSISTDRYNTLEKVHYKCEQLAPFDYTKLSDDQFRICCGLYRSQIDRILQVINKDERRLSKNDVDNTDASPIPLSNNPNDNFIGNMRNDVDNTDIDNINSNTYNISPSIMNIINMQFHPTVDIDDNEDDDLESGNSNTQSESAEHSNKRRAHNNNNDGPPSKRQKLYNP